MEAHDSGKNVVLPPVSSPPAGSGVASPEPPWHWQWDFLERGISWHAINTGSDQNTVAAAMCPVPADPGAIHLAGPCVISDEPRSLSARIVDLALAELLPDQEEHRVAAWEVAASGQMDWLCSLAKLASRDLHFCGLPLNGIAERYFAKEFHKVAMPERKLWSVFSWISEGALSQRVTISSEEYLCDHLIRTCSYSHAFIGTPRHKVRADHKLSGHSAFRRTAMEFVPAAPTASQIRAIDSNHPTAAAARKHLVMHLRAHLANNGFITYDVSVSSAHRDNRTAGRRGVYDIKDLQHADPCNANSHERVVTFIETDIYLDDLGGYAGQAMVFVTPEYTQLSGKGPDSTYYYTADCNGVVSVTERIGDVLGASYTRQRPWDFTANDLVYIRNLADSSFTSYNVHIQYQPGTHRKVVWLCPQTTIMLRKEFVDRLMMATKGTCLSATELKKATNVAFVPDNTRPGARGFLVGFFGTIEVPCISIKDVDAIGPDTSVQMTENQYRTFRSMANAKVRGFGHSEVKRVMMTMDIWRASAIEPIVVDYFKIKTEWEPLPNMMYTARTAPNEQLEDVLDDGTAVPAAPNIAGGGPCVADTKSTEAHTAYKEKRMDAYRNVCKPQPAFAKVVLKLLGKFIKNIEAESGVAPGSVGLVGPDLIYESRRGNAAERLERHNLLNLGKDGAAATNLKTETTPKAPPAPRGVTQYPEGLAIDTGRAGLFAKEILKKCSFYKPGSSPSEISRAIAAVADIAAEVHDTQVGQEVSGQHDTDFTKLDETYSEFIYRLYVAFCKYFCVEADLSELEKILMANVNLTTIIGEFFTKTGWKNNSGSGITTELNTFTAAFIEYCITAFAVLLHTYRARHGTEFDFKDITATAVATALRHYGESTITGGGPPPLASKPWTIKVSDWIKKRNPNYLDANVENDPYCIPYLVIGPKFGDDGNGPHLPGITDSDWTLAADFFTKSIGMEKDGVSTLKVTYIKPGEPCFFLGRWHPDPLASEASYADVRKAIRKLSVSKNADRDKYLLKLQGYWTTDAKTPILGEFLRAVAKMYGITLTHFASSDFTDDITDEDFMAANPELARLYRDDRDMFYRVANGPYNVSEDDAGLLNDAIGLQLDLTPDEIEEYRAGLAACSTWDEIAVWMLPGSDWDPATDPPDTVRVAGPVVNLLAVPASAISTTATAITAVQDAVMAVRPAVKAVQPVMSKVGAKNEPNLDLLARATAKKGFPDAVKTIGSSSSATTEVAAAPEKVTAPSIEQLKTATKETGDRTRSAKKLTHPPKPGPSAVVSSKRAGKRPADNPTPKQLRA